MTHFPLTGKIPGLLRDCSPVILDPSIRDHYGGKSTGVAFAVGNVAALVTFLEDCRPLPIPLEELTLDMFNPTGRFHAKLYLQEHGYDMRDEDRADVLAWNVLSVWNGGKPLRYIAGKARVGADAARLAIEDAVLLADGCALTNPDGTITFPPLPEGVL